VSYEFLLFLIKKTNQVVGFRPDRRLAFFTGLKKVSKERTTLAAGMTVQLVGGFAVCSDRECAASLWQHSVLDRPTML
jgi:hypothetical protein